MQQEAETQQEAIKRAEVWNAENTDSRYVAMAAPYQDIWVVVLAASVVVLPRDESLQSPTEVTSDAGE